MEQTREGAWVRARGPRGHALLVRAFAATPFDIHVAEGATSPLEGWVSSDYGRREPAPILIYSARACLPLRVVTLLFPVDAAEEPAPAVRPLLDAEGVPHGLAFDDHHATFHFRSGTFTIERSRTCTP